MVNFVSHTVSTIIVIGNFQKKNKDILISSVFFESLMFVLNKLVPYQMAVTMRKSLFFTLHAPEFCYF